MSNQVALVNVTISEYGTKRVLQVGCATQNQYTPTLGSRWQKLT